MKATRAFRKSALLIAGCMSGLVMATPAFCMEFVLHRTSLGEHATTGSLEQVDGDFKCATLEDVVRELGPDGSGIVKNETAIPAGEYKLIIEYSNKFKKEMLKLEHVPFFKDVCLLAGSTALDTDGGILVGSKTIDDERIVGGRDVLPVIFSVIKEALNAKEEVKLTIQDEF